MRSGRGQFLKGFREISFSGGNSIYRFLICVDISTWCTLCCGHELNLHILPGVYVCLSLCIYLYVYIHVCIYTHTYSHDGNDSHHCFNSVPACIGTYNESNIMLSSRVCRASMGSKRF